MAADESQSEGVRCLEVGQWKLGSVSEDLFVATTVCEINRLYAQSALETALRIGNYVLETVFDGDIDAVRSKSPKPNSFRKIARHEDLLLSGPQLWRMVAVAAQYNALPLEAQALSLSHQRALLPLRCDTERRRLALAAVAQSWTVRALEVEVKASRRAVARASTEPPRSQGKPPLVATARQLCRAAEEAERQVAKSGLFVSMPTYEVRKILETIETDLGRVRSVVRELWRQLNARVLVRE